MPENLYFRQPQTQAILVDILFIWSKLNDDVSYRQGMHEILAPILWVVERDATESEPSGRIAAVVFDSTYIAHDTFTLFSVLMQHHKPSYAVAPPRTTSTVRGKQSVEAEAPMVGRSRHIMNNMLAKVDPELATHLQKADIVPQVFLMRWIRLLFGREFTFDHVLELWDWMFALDSALECVDLICVAMLLRMRWQLIEVDVENVLPLLLRYPELPADTSAATFVADAVYLHNRLDSTAGAHIIEKYSNRSPPIVRVTSSLSEAADSESHNAQYSTPHRAFSPFTTRSRILQDSGGLEAVLQDAARGVYSRGERWGVNKAVRDAVGEVRKNVQTLQTRSGTPLASGRAITEPTQHESSVLDSSADLLLRLNELETRNRALAKMLQSATHDLWKQQDDVSADDEKTKLFNMAVASVQLVQVYLEDSSLQLPVEEEIVPSERMKDGTELVSRKLNEEHTESSSAMGVLPSSDTSKIGSQQSNPPAPRQVTPTLTIPATRRVKRAPSTAAASADSTAAPGLSSPDQSSVTKASLRPSLQSSYSWMLGQDDKAAGTPRLPTASRGLFGDSSYSTSSPYATSSPSEDGSSRGAPARAGAGFLFGDAQDLAPAAANGLGSHVEQGKGHKRTDSKARRTVSTMLDETEEDGDDIFRLGTMKR